MAAFFYRFQKLTSFRLGLVHGVYAGSHVVHARGPVEVHTSRRRGMAVGGGHFGGDTARSGGHSTLHANARGPGTDRALGQTAGG